MKGLDNKLQNFINANLRLREAVLKFAQNVPSGTVLIDNKLIVEYNGLG